jgi:predicted nucleotidyltransferase
LTHDPSPLIRAECAEALEAASSHSSIVRLLVESLSDTDDSVRAACAKALRRAAPVQAEVRERLKLLYSRGPEIVRAGAARGLSEIDLSSPECNDLLELFLATVASSTEPAGVRFASIWVLASLLGREDMQLVNQTMERCLDEQNSNLRRVALHVLADAIADGRIEWSQPLVERIESMLMAVDNPCPRMVGDLMKIVDMKEMYGGRRLERIVAEALTPLDHLIKSAFIFGSVARLEQIRESDIDLMVIGDVRLKEIAAAVHNAEKILGRAINPVLFSSDKFRSQYREGNPFLLDIVRKEQIFVKGNRDELTELVADGSVGEP